MGIWNRIWYLLSSGLPQVWLVSGVCSLPPYIGMRNVYCSHTQIEYLHVYIACVQLHNTNMQYTQSYKMFISCLNSYSYTVTHVYILLAIPWTLQQSDIHMRCSKFLSIKIPFCATHSKSKVHRTNKALPLQRLDNLQFICRLRPCKDTHAHRHVVLQKCQRKSAKTCQLWIRSSARDVENYRFW